MILTVVVMSTGVGEGRLETTVATAERRASVAGGHCHQHHGDKHAPPLPRQSKATDEAALRTRKRHLMTKHRDLEWNAATKTANDRLRVRCWIEPTCCNNEHIILTGKSCRTPSSMIAERRKQAATASALKRLRKHGKNRHRSAHSATIAIIAVLPPLTGRLFDKRTDNPKTELTAVAKPDHALLR